MNLNKMYFKKSLLVSLTLATLCVFNFSTNKAVAEEVATLPNQVIPVEVNSKNASSGLAVGDAAGSDKSEQPEVLNPEVPAGFFKKCTTIHYLAADVRARGSRFN